MHAWPACDLPHAGSVEIQIGHKLAHMAEELRQCSAGPAAAGGGDGASEEEGEDAEEAGEMDLQAALEAGEQLEQVRCWTALAPSPPCCSFLLGRQAGRGLCG